MDACLRSCCSKTATISPAETNGFTTGFLFVLPDQLNSGGAKKPFLFSSEFFSISVAIIQNKFSGGSCEATLGGCLCFSVSSKNFIPVPDVLQESNEINSE